MDVTCFVCAVISSGGHGVPSQQFNYIVYFFMVEAHKPEKMATSEQVKSEGHSASETLAWRTGCNTVTSVK